MRDKDTLCTQSRRCFCGCEEERLLEPIQAAFEHTRVWEEACLKCGSMNWQSGSCDVPPLSVEQLEIWSKSELIVFIEQDEDLYLAQTDAVELLLIYLDKLTTLREKKKILLAALFVMLFNEGHSDPELVNRISFALKGRKVLVDEIGIRHIGDRVLNVVLPMLEGG